MKEPLSRLDSRTALHIAVYKNEIAQVIDCIKKSDVNLDVTDSKGRTALFYSACYCRREIMDILLKAGSDPNVGDNKGNTPLHEAVENSDVDIVQSLTENGKVNINLKNDDGQTALMKASYYDYVEILSILLKSDADPDVQDNNGRTALHIAFNEGNILSADLLIRYGCNMNLFTASGHSSLYITVHSPHDKSLDMAKLLITSGYDARPDSGWLNEEKHTLFIQDQPLYEALQTQTGIDILPKELNLTHVPGKRIFTKPSINSQSPLVRKLSIQGDDGEIPVRRHYLSPASPRLKHLCSQNSREEFKVSLAKLPLSHLSTDGMHFFQTPFKAEYSSRSLQLSLPDSESEHPLSLPKVSKSIETLSLHSSSSSPNASPTSSSHKSRILDIPKDENALQENDSRSSESETLVMPLPAYFNIRGNDTAEVTKKEDQLKYSKKMNTKCHSSGMASIFKRAKSLHERNDSHSSLVRRKVSFEISSSKIDHYE